MADRKITDLTALAAGSQATGDLVTIVDVSESAAADKNKKMTVENLFKGIPGDVGIGTSSPSSPLHISSSEDRLLLLQSSDANAYLAFQDSDSSGNASNRVGTVSDGLYFNTGGGGTRMTIDSSGNVGIGDTTPDSPFHVKNSANTVARFESTDSVSRIVLKDNAGEIRVGATGDNLTFHTSSGENERARIDSSGRLLVGTTSTRTNIASVAQDVCIERASIVSQSLVANQNASGGSTLSLCLSRGTSVGSNTVVQSGDAVGQLAFRGNDGTNFINLGMVRGEVDGTPGTNDMPGRLTFYTTADGESSPTERVRIDSSGNVGIGHNAPPKQLSLAETTQPTIALYTGSTIRAEFNATSAETSFLSYSNSPFTFNIGGSAETEAVRIDSSGRLLVGTTSALDTTAGAISSNNSSSGGRLALGGNPSSAGSSVGEVFGWWNGNKVAGLVAASGADTTNKDDGELLFYTSASGPSVQERMRIDRSGNIGIGTNSPNFLLDVDGNVGLTEGQVLAWHDGSGNKAGDIYMDSSDNIVFRNTSSVNERMRIDSSGRVLIGTSTSEAFNGIGGALQIEGTSNATTRMSLFRTSDDASASVLVFAKARNTSHAVLSNNDEIGAIEFYGADGNDTNQRAGKILCAVDGTTGSNDMPGRLMFMTTADGASTPTERWRITKDGTFTSKTSDIGSVVGVGVTLEEDGAGIFTRDSASPVFVNRTGNDGDLIRFYQANTQEGSISVSGNTVSLNGGHLARWTQLTGGAERTEILRGSVLSNLDEMCEWGEEDNEQLNRMKISDVEGDVNVAGVFDRWDDDDETYLNDFYCAMTGDFVIRIAQGTTVARGDLLMSAGDGTAKPQDDDIVRSKTIAKVTSTTVSTTYADGSYCVPCVLMAC